MPNRPICCYCERRQAEACGSVCSACRKQRVRWPTCEQCNGPTYGTGTIPADRFCYKCSPRTPRRSPTSEEIRVTLHNPIGEIRVVYRLPRDAFNLGDKKLTITKDDKENGLTLVVPWLSWLRARPC